MTPSSPDSHPCQRKIRIKIQYNGSLYKGWQVQKNTHNTIQGKIQGALYQLTSELHHVYGAGRTDAGVHATAQVAHFLTSKHYAASEFKNAINHFLRGSGIVISHSEEVCTSFHARFDAKLREYTYIILNASGYNPLLHDRAWSVKRPVEDIQNIRHAIKDFEGTHDFSAFTHNLAHSVAYSVAHNVAHNKAVNTLKTMTHASVEASTLLGFPTLVFKFQSKSFLYNQIRIMVGTLYEIGAGKPLVIRDILKSQKRNNAGVAAPPQGLYLTKIEY